ncbi:hypothetical protein NMG60_11000332 [Bertholletia excelsa]
MTFDHAQNHPLPSPSSTLNTKMEFRLPSIEQTNRLLAWSLDDNHRPSGRGRSFTCTFCKRGFSNAQALGGHMNIHRRDRAKLKESCGEDQSFVPLKITQKNPPDYTENNVLQQEYTEEKSCTPKKPWTFSREDAAASRRRDRAEDLQPLYLFMESSSSSNDLQAKKHGLEEMEKSKHAGLDLELRLGLEHHETSPKGTREFF